MYIPVVSVLYCICANIFIFSFFVFLQFNLDGDLPEISNMEIEDLGMYQPQRFYKPGLLIC